MEDKILTIPAVALRGMTILPGMVAHFDISRDKSMRAVEEAMKGDQKLFIVTQKDTEKEDPQGDSQKEPVKTGNQTATTGSLLGLMFAAILVVVAKFRKEKNM